MDKKKRYLMWFTELLIWFLIFAIVASVTFFIKYKHQRDFDTYQIFLPDVDGIIIGSPVRFLGIVVGHISQVHIIKDEVFVRFVITDKTLRLPRGTIATIEFTGLGGSKSLELYPPTEASLAADKFIVSQDPKRIHDAFAVLYDMMDKVGLIAYRCSYFAQKVGIIKQEKLPANSTKSSRKMLNEASLWTDKLSEYELRINKKLKELKK